MRLSHYNAIFLAVILVAAVVIGLNFQSADPGLYDDGLLQLAGATSLLRDGNDSIIQRPPLYSALLAVLAKMQGISVQETTPAAQELGSILFHDVATSLLSPPFLLSVLLLNLLWWMLTVVILLAIIRHLGLSYRWQSAALLMSLVPTSWRLVGSVSEVPLCAFLLTLGIYSLIQVFTKQRYLPILVAGLCFALAGLTRAMYQLLPLALCLVLLPILWKRTNIRHAFVITLSFLLSYILLVGGWSLRNYAVHGFWGVSGISGVALSTRTAEYFERASAAFPEEVAAFRSIRDQLYLDLTNKNDVVYWGARASNWLMAQREMSYLEANRLLFALNVQAIRAAPLNYVDVVMMSVLHFHFPVVNAEWGALPRFVSAVIDCAMIAAFTGVTLLWLAARIFARLRWLVLEWHNHEIIFAFALLLFWYTALISSAVDVGKPEHRLPVQFVVPLVIMVGGHWFYTRTKSLVDSSCEKQVT